MNSLIIKIYIPNEDFKQQVFKVLFHLSDKTDKRTDQHRYKLQQMGTISKSNVQQLNALGTCVRKKLTRSANAETKVPIIFLNDLLL